MRIWIVNHYASPPTHPGGTRHYNFARELKERGHDVLIIAANYNHFSKTVMCKNDSYNQIDNTHAVPFLWIPVPSYKGNTIRRFWNMLVFAWSVFRNKFLINSPPPDVIIGSSPHLFAALGAELLARRLGRPFILEIRDLWPESLVDLGRFTHKHPLIKIMKYIEYYLYARSNKIISLLPSANQYFTNHGANIENVLWIPNYVDISLIPNFTINKNKKFRLMYAGAHGTANDLDTLILAAKILEERGLSENIHISLIGDGPEKMRLQLMVSKHNISMVDFLDSVPKNEIYGVLNHADAYLMLLKDSPVFRWGISPNKLFDYLAMGRPVIFAVNTPFNPIKLFNAGVSVNPGNPEALADAIYALSRLPKNELKAMGDRGRNFVLEYHHLKNLTDSLEKLMDSIVVPTKGHC